MRPQNFFGWVLSLKIDSTCLKINPIFLGHFQPFRILPKPPPSIITSKSSNPFKNQPNQQTPPSPQGLRSIHLSHLPTIPTSHPFPRSPQDFEDVQNPPSHHRIPPSLRSHHPRCVERWRNPPERTTLLGEGMEGHVMSWTGLDITK